MIFSNKKGFTLIELLVSVFIMVLMMMAVGWILSDAQKIVSSSEKAINSNMTAEAIDRLIRTDLGKITHDGFLCITQDGSGSPVILFSRIGQCHSKTSNVPPGTGQDEGQGSVVSLGLGMNPVTGNSLLVRQQWILSTNISGTASDVWNIESSTIHSMDRPTIDTTIDSLVDAIESVSIAIPPRTGTEFNDYRVNTWQVVSTDVSNISIMFTDGTSDASNNLHWYGVGQMGVVPKEPTWASETAASSTLEYSATDGSYRALWNRVEVGIEWPKAIKIRYTIQSPSVSEEVKEIPYEIIFSY